MLQWTRMSSERDRRSAVVGLAFPAPSSAADVESGTASAKRQPNVREALPVNSKATTLSPSLILLVVARVSSRKMRVAWARWWRRR